MSPALLERARAVYASALAELGPPPWLGSVSDLLLDNLPELEGFAEARELAAVLEAESS